MKKYPCWRYERMMPAELKLALRQGPVAYLPVGPLEWHGEHLAFGSDPLRAQQILEGVWKRCGGVLLPTLFVGTDNFKHFSGKKHWGMEMFAKTFLPGSLYVRESTFQNLIEDTLAMLDRQGFKLVVLFTGHEAGNQRRILAEAEKRWASKRMKVSSWWAGRVQHPKNLERDGGHAGEDETSELMAVEKDYARPERAGRLKRDLRVSLGPGIRKVTPQRGRERQAVQIQVISKKVNEVIADLIPRPRAAQ
jgi:creatinine amidohydrolase